MILIFLLIINKMADVKTRDNFINSSLVELKSSTKIYILQFYTLKVYQILIYNLV